ncbi:hypothetical protein ACG3RN_06685 [Pseudomonas aeruginosa]
MRFELRQQAIGVLGLGDDPQVVVRTQQIAHADQGEGVVVDEDDACFHEIEPDRGGGFRSGYRQRRQADNPPGGSSGRARILAMVSVGLIRTFLNASRKFPMCFP